jgi:membrane protein
MKLTSLKTLFKRPFFSFLNEVFSEWNRHGTLVQGAALAFYTIISLPTLILALTGILSFFVSASTARDNLLEMIQRFTGTESYNLVKSILEHTTTSSENVLRIVVGGIVLFFTVTGVFGNLQAALNKIWNAQPKASVSWKRTMGNRFIAFGSFLVIAIIFASSIILNGFISKADFLFSFLQGNSYVGIIAITLLSNIIISTLLFTLLFKILPDAKTHIKDAIIGGLITTGLFLVGESILTLYFRYNNLQTSYGVTGSLVVLMLWIYYSAQILFIGAEITQVYARHHGKGIKLEDYAEKKLKTS